VTEILGPRALNRALLERQLLLCRVAIPVDRTLEHLVGVQAQAALAPYVGLWSRLDGFQPGDLSDLISDRRAVRVVAMLRSTIHLFTAADGLALRPVLQTMLERTFRRSPFAQNLVGLDVAQVLAAGRDLLEHRPLTASELARELNVRWPDRDGTSLSYAVRYLLPLVQVPPRGIWGSTGPARIANLETWLGRPLGAADEPDAWILRYLRAFGPATVADIGTWSWLTNLRPVVERLRPKLRTFHDEHGKELFDVPDGPLPDPGTPAPVRFLPEYDNVLLSHADRTRIVPRGRRIPLPPGNGAVMGTILVNGWLRGTWKIVRQRTTATLEIAPDVEIEAADRLELESEGDALLAFAAADADRRDVRIAASQVTS
jgi:hypothetical protein